MPDNSSICGELIEPAQTTTSRPPRPRALITNGITYADAAPAFQQHRLGQRAGLRYAGSAVRGSDRGNRWAVLMRRPRARWSPGSSRCLPASRRCSRGYADADLHRRPRSGRRGSDRARRMVTRNGPSRAAKFVIAAIVTFHPFEQRQHVRVAPTLVAHLRPGVEILSLAADECHAVDRDLSRRAASTRHRQAAPVGVRLGFGCYKASSRRGC